MKRFRQTFAHTENGVRRVWDVERLQAMAADLPVKSVPLDSISALDEVTWFSYEREQHPTCRRVAEHARRIYEADLAHPVILSAEGWVMDGMHRICKAYLLGHTSVQAVQFERDPEPDDISS